jgi:hypothetical protein
MWAPPSTLSQGKERKGKKRNALVFANQSTHLKPERVD